MSIGTKYGDREIGIASGAGLSASGIVNYTEYKMEPIQQGEYYE